MGVQHYSDYTCDSCGKKEERQALSQDTIPRSWSKLQMQIWPAKGQATIRKVNKMMCDSCTNNVIVITTPKVEG